VTIDPATEYKFFGRTPREEGSLILGVLYVWACDYLECPTALFSDRAGLARDAKEWSDADDDDPFSFRWCCEALGIDSRDLLKCVSSLCEQPRSKKHKWLKTIREMGRYCHGRGNK